MNVLFNEKLILIFLLSAYFNIYNIKSWCTSCKGNKFNSNVSNGSNNIKKFKLPFKQSNPGLYQEEENEDRKKDNEHKDEENNNVEHKASYTKEKSEHNEEQVEENAEEVEINDNILYIKPNTIISNEKSLEEVIEDNEKKNIVNENYIAKAKIYNCNEKAFELEYKIDKEFENNPFIIAIVKLKIDEVTTKNYIISYLNYDDINGKGLFQNCEKIIEIKILESKKISNMTRMFSKCTSLQNIDLSNFDTSSAIKMNFMFFECKKLEELDLSNFNTNSVKDMRAMFYECYSLKELNLFNFNINRVSDIRGMFSGCSEQFQNKIKAKYKNIKEEAFH